MLPDVERRLGARCTSRPKDVPLQTPASRRSQGPHRVQPPTSDGNRPVAGNQDRRVPARSGRSTWPFKLPTITG
jgi:hypothetical protein